MATGLTETTAGLKLHIRWMIRRDMAEVLEIEKLCFEYPWDDAAFVSCLRQRNCIGLVAQHKDDVIGYSVYELHKTRLHMLNFAVLPAFHRRGVGRAMMEKLHLKLSAQRRTRILLEVREGNLDAQLFWRAMGYRCVSVLRGYYDDTPEDAYVMQVHHRDLCFA